MYTSNIKTTDDSLERIGGKGRSLARMTCAGFDVPGGFLVTADAYRTFIAENNLQSTIVDRARPTLKDGYPAFETCAEQISELILNAPMSVDVVEQIKVAYGDLEDANLPVAVRSSANAEDLPDFSFAGQQETYLNVRGEDAVVRAVQKCWASLWTAQAISYRHNNGIAQDKVAMAVVVQTMVPSEVSGILFTANPTSGERSEIIINASYGLGEAVVSGQVTPDTYIVQRPDLSVKESVLGPKEQKIVYDGEQGIRIEDVSENERHHSSLSDAMINELCKTSVEIEGLYDGLPQDIEWAFCDGKLHLLQSRPITNLLVQPIDVEWVPTLPAKCVSRRQIAENMPDPICPLFEDLYLTQGLEAPRDKSLMVGGGPLFVSVNGYAYQRFDYATIHNNLETRRKRNKDPQAVSEQDIEAAEYAAFKGDMIKLKAKVADAAAGDIEPFRNDMTEVDRVAFDQWYGEQTDEEIKSRITMPESTNPTYVAFNNTKQNDAVLKYWYEKTLPRLESAADKWRILDFASASDLELFDGICELAIEEGRYWSDDSTHTFGVAKSTDDQLQCFLQETLPDHNFISGQFLTGIESKTMQSNADLFKIAEMLRSDPDLTYTVLVVPSAYLLQALKDHEKAADVVVAVEQYLKQYGHQGYSMDFIEPTQMEDPSALFASLKGMVRDRNYHPKNQGKKTAEIRAAKYKEISQLLSGLEYWQFRFRWWLARKYNFIREEVAFRFGYTWSILRPMAYELNRRLVEAEILVAKDDIFFLTSVDIKQAIKAKASHQKPDNYGQLASQERALREARKRHHPPGTLPAEVASIEAVSFKETQIKNDESSHIMRGFAVSSGTVTAKASVISGPSEFDNMTPGSILVSPLTTPAWTQLFANCVGLVTDVGSILAHGSIVAREYGIPAVLGVGDGTKRIRHGQTITIDGDLGTVFIHEDE